MSCKTWVCFVFALSDPCQYSFSQRRLTEIQNVKLRQTAVREAGPKTKKPADSNAGINLSAVLAMKKNLKKVRGVDGDCSASTVSVRLTPSQRCAGQP